MTLCLGMSGSYVMRVQEFLSALHLYSGPLDSSFGGGTLAAVTGFQKQHGLPATGRVDAASWALMFPGQPAPVSPLDSQPLPERCLALTGSFETSTYPPASFSGLAGDFDGMGISLGACQWNIGQGTLQPLLSEMFEKHTDLTRSIFGDSFDVLAAMRDDPLADQLAFARSIQYKGTVNEPWRGMLVTLGRTPEFQQIQTNAADVRFKAALQLCGQFSLTSERAVAMMFDVVVQNGSISSTTAQTIRLAFQQLPAGRDDEPAKLAVVAHSVANSSAPRYASDVLGRKLLIAQGAGTFRGCYYDLAEMFGIGLKPFAG